MDAGVSDPDKRQGQARPLLFTVGPFIGRVKSEPTVEVEEVVWLEGPTTVSAQPGLHYRSKSTREGAAGVTDLTFVCMGGLGWLGVVVLLHRGKGNVGGGASGRKGGLVLLISKAMITHRLSVTQVFVCGAICGLKCWTVFISF